MISGSTTVGLADVPYFRAVVQDFAVIADVEGMLDDLDADDCRARAVVCCT